MIDCGDSDDRQTLHDTPLRAIIRLLCIECGHVAAALAAGVPSASAWTEMRSVGGPGYADVNRD